MVATSTVPSPGGSHSTISFPIVPNSTGPLEVRISVLMEGGSDNDWSDNVREKTLLVDSDVDRTKGCRDDREKLP